MIQSLSKPFCRIETLNSLSPSIFQKIYQPWSGWYCCFYIVSRSDYTTDVLLVKFMAMMDQHSEGSPQYKHIQRNDFLFRKHKKQKEEDIVVCDCRYNPSDPDSACGERCLNVLTSTECTPGYCPCGSYCKNQKFQRCEYAKSRLFKTEGRGWGVLADEDIKAGQFIIEYCGEVISCIEAKKRSHAYENQGLRDAYIISLNAQESIDATNKGSLARFINHSCQPNCETRKWNVLGEIRVGIFSKQDIPAGAELAYDYNFEWYGGAKVRCLCGAHCCSGFLGAKSRGFQEDTHVWEDNDARYSVENIPLYDTEEDEPIPKLLKGDSTKLEPNSNERDGFSVRMGDPIETGHNIQATALVTEPTTSVPMEGVEMEVGETEWSEEKKLLQHETRLTLSQGNAMISRIRSNSACRNYHIQTSPLPKKRTQNSGRSKNLVQKEVDAKLVGQLLSSKEAREEVNQAEEMKMRANSKLNSVFNEIRPAIEEHERDNQDSVPTNVAEAWIGAHCSKLKADFDFNFSIIKNLACTPGKKWGAESSVEATENDMK